MLSYSKNRGEKLIGVHDICYTSGVNPKLTQTDEQKKLLQKKKVPVFFMDADGNATHVIFPIEDARRMCDEDVRRELQIGFDQAARGESTVWDPEEVKTEGRRRLMQRSKSP